MRPAGGALALGIALSCLTPAAAQQDDPASHSVQQAMQRSSIERDQQSEAFALELRQQQERLQAAPDRLPALEARQLRERQAFDNLSEQQRSDLSQPAWGPVLRSAAELERERRMLLDAGKPQ